MATISAPVTPAEFELLDPEGRFELLNGEVVEMPDASAAHNYVAGKLERRLGACLDERTRGVAIHETEFLIGENRFRPVLDRKVASYLEGGVAEVWVLYHETEHMLIYTSDYVRMLHRNSILETPLLPGWSLAMSDLLRQQDGVYL